MVDSQAEKSPSLLVSSVTAEGTLVETILDEAKDETGFAVWAENTLAIQARWESDGQAFAPPRAGNNLIKHRALLLPSCATEYSTTDTLLEQITSHIRHYVSLPDAAMDLCAAYVLLSWVYDAFNELPYLRFRGDYGTGKTRALLVVGSLCYKPFFASGASTVSPIFHTLDLFRGTLIFDEADFRFSDEKAELVKILNNGNVRGFPVLRTQVTPKKEFDPRAFSVFGPKIVGMRRTYEDRALESRFLTIEMESGHAGSVPINLPDIQKEEALALRNKLLMYRMRNRCSLTLNPALADAQLEPRMNQILLPLLSVAPDARIRDTILAMANRLQTGLVYERGVSSEGQLLAVLAAALQSAARPLALSAITESFAAQHGTDYQRPVVNRWIGALLRRLGIVLYKSNGVTVLLPGQDERIAALCARYGITQVDQAPAAHENKGDRELGSGIHSQP